MRYKIEIEQPVVIPVVVTAESKTGAIEKLGHHREPITEELGDQIWEEPRIRSVVELGE